MSDKAADAGQGTPNPADDKSTLGKAAATPEGSDGKEKAAADDKANGAKPDAGKADDTGKKPGDEGKEPGKVDGADDGKPKPPEKYDLKVPEHGPFEATDLERYAARAKALGLTNEAAQQWVDADAAELDARRQTLYDELKADKELGGTKFDETVALAGKGMKAFFHENPQGLERWVNVLKATGLDNDRDLVRAFARLGRLVAEDKGADGGKPGGEKQQTAAQKMYPSMAS